MRSSRARALCPLPLDSKPFIGFGISDIPPGVLPSIETALKVVYWHREQPGAKKKPVKDFCCGLTRNKVALCLVEGGCAERDQPCLGLKIKMPFLQAGIQTVSDEWILKRLQQLQEKYNMMFRHRNIMTVVAKKNREQYTESIKKTFD